MAAVALLAGGVVAPARAQNPCANNPCTGTNTVSVTLGDIMRLTVTPNSTDLGTPTAADFAAGHLDAAGPVLAVHANGPWQISVVGGPSGGPVAPFSCTLVAGCRANKPAAELLWGTTSGVFTHNAGTAANVFVSSQAATGTATQSIFYRTNWSFALDTPGKYTLFVNFTLSMP